MIFNERKEIRPAHTYTAITKISQPKIEEVDERENG